MSLNFDHLQVICTFSPTVNVASTPGLLRRVAAAADKVAQALLACPVEVNDAWMGPDHPAYGQGYHKFAPLVNLVRAVRTLASAPGEVVLADWPGEVTTIHEGTAWAQGRLNRSPAPTPFWTTESAEDSVAVAAIELGKACLWVLGGREALRYCGQEGRASEEVVWMPEALRGDGPVWQKHTAWSAVRADRQHSPCDERAPTIQASTPSTVIGWAEDYAEAAYKLWGCPRVDTSTLPEVKVWPWTPWAAQDALPITWAEDGLRKQAAGGEAFRPMIVWDGGCPMLDRWESWVGSLSPSGAILATQWKAEIEIAARRKKALVRRCDAGTFRGAAAAGFPDYNQEADEALNGDKWMSPWCTEAPISDEEIERWNADVSAAS